MTTTVDEASSTISLDAVTAGAQAIAEALELGASTPAIDGWPIGENETVFAASFTGAIEGALLLAVNQEIAGRLLADEHLLRAGFERTLEAILASAGIEPAATITGVGASDLAGTVSAEIQNGGEVCAHFGIAVTSPVGSHEGSGAGVAGGLATPQPAAFEPAALVSNGQFVATPSSGPLTLLQEVEMDVTVELGRTTMPIRELLALQPGMVIEIDRAAGTPIDVLVNGRLIACGEVVVIDEEFGLRITDIVDSVARV